MACTSCKKKKEIVAESAIQIVNSQFKLRDNVGLQQISFGSGLFISNSNVSDELAVQFLKENPNRISLFDVYPNDWKNMLEEIVVEKNKKETKGKSK